MTAAAFPLVSIVTPLYNNAEHVAECIESVLAQTYPHWDYTIVNNCSTDGSLEIATRYAAKDPRIKVHNNTKFLPVVANHNHALRQLSPDCRYVKMVFADDWLFPRCIEEMVALAEQNPSIGIVGAYGLEEERVAWQGLSLAQSVISGHELCRRMFLDDLYVFGTANSLLYRADLVRAQPNFFNEANFHADREVCVALLKGCDFGFVHQILTFKRLAEGSLTREVGWQLMTHYGGLLQTIQNHAADFLSREEVELCRNRVLADYYNFLAVSALRGNRDRKFWSYHEAKLNETVGFSRMRLLRAVLGRSARMIANPHETFSAVRASLRQRAASGRHRKASRQELSARAVEFENCDKRTA